MRSRVLVLGAGFGGLELATVLSDALGEDAGVTLIDKADAFVFGYSKLDVMFGRVTPEEVRLPYEEVVKPGVRFLRETITAIDPEARRVTTDAGEHEGDVLVVALGADYDFDATPGLAEANEFYSVAGAERLREVLPDVHERPRGRRRLRCAVQVPARAERGGAAAARLPDRARRPRRLRDLARDAVRQPGTAVARTRRPRCSQAFAERDIEWVPNSRVGSLDPGRGVVVFEDGTELPYDLFLGVPKHRAPDVVLASGMAEDGYIPVDSRTLETRYPGVYAVGDVATVGVAQGGRVLGGRGTRRRRDADRADGRVRRARLLLHRVRSWPYRSRRRRLPLRPEPDRHVPGAVERPRRREEAVRRQPPGPVVRPLREVPPLRARPVKGQSERRI